jgi:segregation and condensation protein B
MEKENEIQDILAAIEAILFTMGNSVQIEKLAVAINHDEKTTIKLVHHLADIYENEKRGMKIIELDNSFQMCTRPEYYENLIKVASAPKKQVLTDVILETLSIVAYKQPITKAEIEKIRGVKTDHAVNKLIEYGLIEEIGRLDAPGRPILFSTTEEFLRRFGVASMDDLPQLKEEQVEELKEEAEEEMQLTLNL